MMQNAETTMTESSPEGGQPSTAPETATSQTDPPAVETRNVTATYGGPPVLKELNLAISGGELTALIGPNGAGKSTFFKLLSGVMRPVIGEVRVFGRSIREQRVRSAIAYVPQEESIDWDFPISVRSVVLAGRFGRMRADGFPRRLIPPWMASATHRQAVEKALEAVEMEDLAHRPIGALSGGQKKRVFLARALAQDARILLLDEPLAGVDSRSAEVIFDVFRRTRDEGRTLLLVTHDLASVEKYADRAVLLNRTVMATGAPSKVMTLENLARAFEGGYIPGRSEAAR